MTAAAGPGAPGGAGRRGREGLLPGGAAGVRAEAPWDPPHTPPQPLPAPTPISRLCLLAPAGRSPGSEDVSGHPRPANSEKCEMWGVGVGEGRQKLGASHPSGNLRSSPVLRGPAGTQTTPHSPLPHPEGTSCSV